MAALKTILGCILIATVLWDAFETIILPRRPRTGLRLTRMLYALLWRPWKAAALAIRERQRRDRFLSLFGPLSFFFLLLLWVVCLILGFAVLQWAAGSRLGGGLGQGFGADLYYSGSTFFTLGLGEVFPLSNTARFLSIMESGTGLALLALVISYLPVLYQSFSRREVNISLLDARAGTPPTSVELLRRHSREMPELLRVLIEWERWSAELLESHMSYPVLAYFRSQHDNQSWLASLTAVLDTCALCLVGIEAGPQHQARLTFAIARHALVDLAQVFNTPPCKDIKRLPPENMARLRELLRDSGLQFPDCDEAELKLTHLRSLYEPYAAALAQFLLMDLPPWMKPQPAADNWETSRWGRGAVV
ncbi:MAG: two pore domain potassium channel family protein [Acidobacteria bacterium]|nr:two pore domain potassium channel family protein [Acidobacteriota bacterium]